jgi:hypothetical protein
MAPALQTESKRPARPRAPWYVRLIMVSFRTVLFTLFFAALGMGAGLLVGIIVTVVLAAVHSVAPNMTHAYRYIAIPVALTSGSCAFVWNVFRGVKDAVSARTATPTE